MEGRAKIGVDLPSFARANSAVCGVVGQGEMINRRYIFFVEEYQAEYGIDGLTKWPRLATKQW